MRGTSVSGLPRAERLARRVVETEVGGRPVVVSSIGKRGSSKPVASRTAFEPPRAAGPLNTRGRRTMLTTPPSALVP